MAFISKGGLKAATVFETFPTALRARLAERIRSLTDRLYAAVLSAAPEASGKLKSEIKERVFDDTATRLAGYVSVYAGSGKAAVNEYRKAATLEYGSHAARRIFARGTSREDRLKKSTPGERMTKPLNLIGKRYLRQPLQDLEPIVQAEVEAAVQQAVNDAEGSA